MTVGPAGESLAPLNRLGSGSRGRRRGWRVVVVKFPIVRVVKQKATNPSFESLEHFRVEFGKQLSPKADFIPIGPCVLQRIVVSQ